MDIIKTPLWLVYACVTALLWIIWHALPGFIIIRSLLIMNPNLMDSGTAVFLWGVTGVVVNFYFPIPQSIKDRFEKFGKSIEPSDF